MKKTKITKGVVVFIFCLLVKLSLFAQSTFQKSYSTSIDDSPMQFIQTTDKGFAILGLPEDYNFEYLIKTDSLGNKIWSKEYEYNNPLGDMVNGNIIQTSDKGYLICDTHILIKTDSLGTLLWSNYYTSGSSNLLNSAIEVPGGYVVAGTTLKNNAALLMKINLSGNILWTNESFGGDALNMSWSKTDSCFYLIAVSDSAGGYTSIIKIDKNGNTKWSKHILINSNPFIYVNYYIYGIPQAQIGVEPNGKSIAASVSNSQGVNIWFDFDRSGAIINALLYPVSVSYFSWSFCKQTSQNEMLFVIGTNDTNSGTSYNHIVLFKADSAGDIKWAKRIGGVKTDYPAFVLQTSDHGIGVLGATQNFTNGALSIYFVKTDSIGNSNCNIDTFHINQLAPVTVALSDNKVVSIVSNTNNSIPVTVNSIINDSIFDDCICHKPHANFVFYQSGMGSPSTSSDGSTWATHWYWSFGDGTYDSVDITPIHQYKDTGSYNVCLTVKNACAVDSLCQVLFYPDTTLGIKTITDNNKINVFPNPSKGLFNFQFEKMNQKGEIEIYNMLGKQVYNETLRQVQGDVRIDLSGQLAGIYLYRIISENGKAIASGKLVIQ